MRIISLFLISFLLSFSVSVSGQGAILEGYVFENNNRGYLNLVKIEVSQINGTFKDKTLSNKEGFFTLNLPVGQKYTIKAIKDVFEYKEIEVSTEGKKIGDKVYAKVEMVREPGYLFDVTMAEKFYEGAESVDAITGSLIEIYNNTRDSVELVLSNHPSHTFTYTFEQGNHYTVMIRKEGYFTKRMEAYVNVDGCIMCFDGIDEIQPGQPGVSDNLTAGHQMGVLVANVELEKIIVNKPIEVENIYYDLGKSEIRPDAAKQLDGVIHLMKNNPSLSIELGSHTDSRGQDEFNAKLSSERAMAAVNYIVNMGDVPKNRISGVGYGESNLANGCKNGVKCSERKHQENRRTTIKITGVSDYDPFKDKSLAEIIKEDKFAETLAEIQDQEVLEIKEGEEIPEEIRMQLEAQAKEESSTATIVEKAKQIPPTKAEPTAPVKEIVEEVVVDSDVVWKEQSSMGEPTLETKVETQQSSIEQVEEIITVPESSIGAAIHDSREMEVNRKSNYARVKTVDPKYTGYLIEFMRAREALPTSHEVFKKHGNIKIDTLADGTVSYMLGAFKSKGDANKFLEHIISPQYPKAKLIKYANGSRGI